MLFLTTSKHCSLRIMKIGDQTLVKNQIQDNENWGSDFSKNLPQIIFNPILPLGPLWLPLFSQLLGHQKLKTEPLHIYNTRSTYKYIRNNSRFPSLANRGQQILVDIIVAKFKIFKILSFKGKMNLKNIIAETCAFQIEVIKQGLLVKKLRELIFKIGQITA